MSVSVAMLLFERSTSTRRVQSRVALSPCGVQPSVPVAHRSFPCTIADSKLVLLGPDVLIVPPCSISGTCAVVLAIEIFWVLPVKSTLFCAGVPVIRTSFMKLFDDPPQFQTTYCVLSDVLAFTGVVGIE